MKRMQFGLIGYPVKHSLSPAMQNAAFRALGIDAEYRLYEVEGVDVASFLENRVVAGMGGINVTIPHKIAVKRYLEKHGSLDDNSRKMGAVNTIVNDGGRLKGFNTDGPGFGRSLKEDLRFDVAGKSVLVLGCGGAASAIVMYLGIEPKQIFITDVDSAKAHDLTFWYSAIYDKSHIMNVNGRDLKDIMGEVDLVVNATPIGMHGGDETPLDTSLLRKGMSVYDLVYNVPKTTLVSQAIKAGIPAVNGIGMLLHQGAIAFELWTRKAAPVDVMRTALSDALKGPS